MSKGKIGEERKERKESLFSSGNITSERVILSCRVNCCSDLISIENYARGKYLIGVNLLKNRREQQSRREIEERRESERERTKAGVDKLHGVR